MKNTFVRMTIGVVSMLAVLIVTSCDIGLGPSVDTASPTLTIDYPPASAVIRDYFTFGGTCSDDMVVSKVEVTVTNTELTTDNTWSYTATIDSTGKAWYVEKLNEADATTGAYPFPDGKYEISAVAYDNASHNSGTSSRSFEIDNTAPLFILKSPSSIKITSPTAYGAQFKITGTIADDHSVKTMAVSIYNEDGTVIDNTDTAPYTANNVETAGGTSVTIAKYLATGTATLNNRYNTIYAAGDTSLDTRAYTCKIKLIDAAKEYKNMTVSDKDNTTTGNETSVFYLSDDVKSTLDADELEASDAKKILNGTYSGDVSEETQAAIKALFAAKGNTTAAFSLNPDASPKYSVTGYKFTALTASSSTDAVISDNTASSKQKVTVVATAGRDDTYVNPATLVVYQFGPYGTANLTASILSSIYSDPAAYATENASLSHILLNESGEANNTAYASGSVETYTYPVYLYDTIDTGKYYVIAVTGVDADSVDMTPQDGCYYGFTGATSGTPPSLSWDSYNSTTKTANIADLGYTNTNALTFSGMATSKATTISSVTYTVSVTDESSENSGTQVGTLTGTATLGSEDSMETTWSFSLADATGFTAIETGKEYLYTIDMLVTDDNQSTAESEKRIHIDTVKPSVEITSVSPTVIRSSDSKACVNGKVDISCSVTETNLSSSSYKVYVGTASEASQSGTISGYSPSFTVDTTSLTDLSTISVVVTSIDKAGNTGTYTTWQYNKEANLVNADIVIDQSTDEPSISFSNADETITSDVTGTTSIKAAYANVQAGTASVSNIFGTTSNNIILGTIADDDGIKTVTVGYRTFGSTDEYTTKQLVTNGTKTTYSLSYVLPTTCAAYNIKVFVEDNAGEATSYNSNTATFVVAVDDGAPTFSNVTPTDGGYYTSTVTVAGKVTDASGEISVQLTSSNETSKNYSSATTTSDTEATLSDTLTITTVTDSKYTAIYTATDKYGQAKTYSIIYNIDTTSPVLSTITTSPAASSSWISNSSPTINVLVKDPADTLGNCSGILSVQYVLNETTYVALTSTGDADTNGYYTYTGILNLKQGENSVTIKATDNATNSVTSSSYTFNVDSVSPTITVPATTSYDAEINATEYAAMGTTAITLTPTIVDEGSGAIKAWVSTSASASDTYSSAVVGVTLTTATTSSWQPSLAIPKTAIAGDKVYTYYIIAEDVSGRITVSDPITITVDTTAPTLSITNTGFANDAVITETDAYITASGSTYTYSVRGKWSDNVSGTSTLYYSTGSSTIGSGTWGTVSDAPQVTTAAAWEYAIVNVTQQSGYQIAFYAVDTFGNTSAVTSFTNITFDFSVPVITLTESTSTTTTKSAYTLTGTVTDGLAMTTTSPYGIAVTATLNGSDVSSTTIASLTTYSEVSSGTSYQFVTTVPVTSTTYNGTWLFTVNATDKAGRSATAKSAEILIDTRAPTGVDNTISSSWRKDSTTQALEVHVSDSYDTANSVALASTAYSGISTVQYTVSGATTKTATNLANSGTYATNTSYTTYASTLSLGQGTNTVTVTASDVAGNSATIATGTYKIDTVAPVLSSVSVASATINATAASSGVAVSATATDATSGTVKLWISTSSSADAAVSALDSETTTATTSAWTPTTLAIPATAFQTSGVYVDGTYQFYVHAMDEAGNESVSSALSILLDKTAPVVKISAVTPVVSKTANSTTTVYVNGTITVSGTVTEANLSDVTYTVYVDDVAVATLTNKSLGAVYAFALTVDTTTLTNAKNIYVAVTATDTAGNSSSYTTTTYNNAVNGVSTEMVIDQSTDVPTISFTNADDSIDTVAGIKTAVSTSDDITNLYGVSSNNKINATITDDDGVASVYVYKRTAGTTSYETTAFWSKTGLTTTTYPLTLTLPTTEGAYDLKFVVTDTVGSSTTYGTTYNVVSDELTVAVDAGAPTFSSVTLPNGTYYGASKTLTVTGVATDASGTVTLLATHSSGVSSYSTETGVTSGATWTDTMTTKPTSDGTYTITYTATDAYGQSATTSVSYVYDTTAPLFTTGNTTYPDYINSEAYSGTTTNWYKSQTLPISGCWTETGSGIAKVYYQISTADTTTTMTTTNYATTGVATNSFYTTDQGTVESYDASIGSFTEGTNYLILVAVDKAGNAGAMEKRTIYIDLEAPTIEPDSSEAVLTNGSKDISVSGMATDTASGIASVSLYIGSSTYTISSTDTKYGTITLTQSGTATITASDGTTSSETLSKLNTRWTLSIDADCTTTAGWFNITNLGSTPAIYATVTDTAGNSTSKVRVSSLTIDQTAPVVAVKSPTASSSINGQNNMSGTVTETYPLSLAMYYRFSSTNASLSNWTLLKMITTASGTSDDTTTYGASVSDIYNWTFSSVDVTTLATNENAFTNGVATLYILPVAYDEAGNCSISTTAIVSGNYTTYSVDLNTDRPNVKITNLNGNGTTLMYGDNAAITGTVTDDDSTSSAVVNTFVASSTAVTAASSATTTEGDGTSVSFPVVKDSAKKTISYTIASGSVYTTVAHTLTVDGSSYTAYDITIFNPATGDFTFVPYDISDGSKDLYFYIQDNADTSDNANTVFYTANSSTLYDPYVQFKSNTKQNNTAKVTYVSDSQSPSITGITGAYSSDGTTAGGTLESITTSVCLGGTTKKYVKFAVTAKDASGIASMSLTASDTGTKAETIATGTNGTFTASSSNVATTWTTNYISLSGWATGTVSVVITAYDQSGLYANYTSTFYLDNSSPTVTATSPLTTDEVTADISITGTAADVGNASVSSAAWLIPTTAQAALSDADLLNETWGTIDSGTSATAWKVSLAEATICGYDNTTTYATTEAEESTTDIPIYLVPFYVLVKDTVGNYTVLKHTIRHNPNANIPSASFAYPTIDDYDVDSNGTTLSYVTLGGTIRVSGTAKDNVSVSAVYLQIDMDPTVGGTNTFDSTDKASVVALTNESAVSYYTVVDATGAGITSGAESGWWGIKVTNTSSWSITLNANSELDAATSGELHYIRIRACAVDNDNLVGAWSTPVFIAIDNNAPKIGSTLQKLYQYSTFSSASPTTNISASQDYEAGTYLKGTWYLALSLEDEGGIDTYSVKQGSSTLSTSSYTVATVTSNGITNYNVYIPVDTTSSTVTYTIYATDYATSSTTAHTSTKTYTLYTDNVAPTIDTLKGNSTTLLSNPAAIQNSNYIYTLSGSITEESSGFQRLVFYFLRSADNVSDGSVSRIYDPLVAYNSTYDSTANYSATTALAHSRTNTADLTALSVTQGSTSYTMYGKTYTSGTCSGNAYTHDDISDNSHIRVGGLIYIGGVYRLITAVSGDVVTFNSAATTSDTTAVFPYVQVVDDTITEKTSLNDVTHRYTLTTDDGDNMPETVTKATTTYTWDATLYTDDLPDGPITLVCLAFDEAGNVSGTSVVTKIQNNAPRLAKMYLGTDLSGDGTYASDEFNVYSFNAAGTNANYKDAITFATAGTTYANYGTAFTVKNGLAVIPEITGGNGTIKMAYLYSAGDADTAQTSSGTNVVFVSPESGATTVTADFSSDVATNSYTNVADTLNAYVLTNYNITNKTSGTTLTASDNAATRAMSFTFWDSTDGYVCGTDSYECFAGITDFCVNIVDGTIPAGTITPYTTDTVADNIVTNNSVAQGHIDLTNVVNATYPAVSGKIKISGTASDDTRLKLLEVTFADLSVTKYSTYSASLASQSASAASYYAVYVPGNGWVISTPSDGAAADIDTDGWTFAVTNNSLTQTQHTVDWELDIDTAKLTGIAGKAKAITVTVTDAAGNTNTTTVSGASQTATGALTPKYTVDVVPYITKLARASGNSLRSRLGKLQVVATDTIAVTGFNMPSTSSTSTSDTSNLIFVNSTSNAAAVDTATGTGYKYTVTTSGSAGTFATPSASGYVRVITNGVSSLNNCDENADYNYESTDYSTKSTGTDDDTSTDFYYNDRYISVWQTATTFNTSAQAISPTLDKYDVADSTNSIAKNTVRGSWSSDAALFYDELLGGTRTTPFGTTSMKDSPDDADMTIVNGSPFYVVLDNWQASGYQWSANGLFVARRGWTFSQGTVQTTNGYSTAAQACEIQGNYYSSSPDSSDGMDEMLYQFQNPKIAVYYGGTSGTTNGTYYVYVSYYDAYAHCLKYSKFTYSGTGTTPTAVAHTVNGNEEFGYYVVDGYDTTVSEFSDYAVEVGEYSDIAIDTHHDSSAIIPVLAYCDTTNGTLKIARGKTTTPTSSNAVITTAGTTPSATRGWYYTTIANPTGAQLGNYVSMTIDDSGNLHIATQDATNGDLYYLYLTYSSSADSGYTLVSCTKVDAENSVGKWTDIKLTDSSKLGLLAGPVISYLDATNINSKKAVKAAFVNSASAAATGVWDHMVAPVTYAGYDEKTSLVLSAYDGASVLSRIGIGYKSASFATAFMRSE